MEVNRITIPDLRRVAGRTANGRNIRNYILYRSGASILITVQDIDGIRECGIRHIVDLRSDEECCAYACQLSDVSVSHHMSTLKTRGGLENFYSFVLIDKSLTAEGIKRVVFSIHEGYRVLPFRNPALVLLLNLTEADDGAILPHCSSGKDRTGVPAALLQRMLGVKENVVMQEYLLSNACTLPDILCHAKELGFQGDTRGMLVHCCSVHESLLCSSLNEVEKRYLGWEEFSEAEYGMSEKRIRSLKKRCLGP